MPKDSHQTSQHWYLPVIQHGSRIAMKLKRPYDSVPISMSNVPYASATSQSASLLHKDYGQTLNTEIMKVDAFYALSELFFFSASSTCQFLNLIEKQINNQEHPILPHLQNCFDNLQYTKEVLEELLGDIELLLGSIAARGTLKWPKASLPAHVEIVNRMAETLLEDYRHIEIRIKRLSTRCSAGMTLIMNTALLAESRRGFEQAGGMARLTLLAFFFIPLSFTSSFFGMNFKELGNNNLNLSIWVWFVVSVPIFVLSVVLCFWSSVHNWARNLIRIEPQ
jgi:Mg2+ and Co2+ transporter CorA